MAATKAASAKPKTPVRRQQPYGTCPACSMIRLQVDPDGAGLVTVLHRAYVPEPDGPLPGRMEYCPGSALPATSMAPDIESGDDE